jgi:feruloyl esterase
MSFLIIIVLTTITNVKSQFLTLQNPNLKPAYDKVSPVMSIDNLHNLSVPNTVIESVVVDPKGFCQVIAIINNPPSTDRVKVWINMPLKNWNGRFCGTGGGGFAGGFPDFMADLTKQGFAVGCSNTGHDGWSGSFALDTVSHRLNWQEIKDYAYLGIHNMTVFSKVLIKAYYGNLPKYSYFIGGSNGGRQGMNEVQRYPDDYDGILAYFPAMHVTQISVGGLWPQAVMIDAKHFVSVKKQIAVTKAAVDACDGNDGLKDGVISDPGRCFWDPTNFVGAKVENEVFTEADANVMRKIWEGPRTHDGKFLWYGMPRGSATTDLASEKANTTFFEYLKFLVATNPNWDISNLNIKQFELFWNQSSEQYKEVFRADNPNLEPYSNHGGKLLLIHGMNDQLVPYQGSVEYYESVLNLMGGYKSTSDFIRLFLVPGVDHSLNGAGLKPIGEFDTLVRWVEEGEAPDMIMTEKDKSRRPVFPYPNVARYNGVGNPNEAESFIKYLPR